VPLNGHEYSRASAQIGHLTVNQIGGHCRQPINSALRPAVEAFRDDAIQRSLAVTKGKVTEHIVPYLPGFDLDPKDIRFLGTPIDLIAFKGLDASVEEVEIVFIEVKTGGSVLTPRQRAVKRPSDNS
jgi:predicted Holliday junction resolvase-like endonuclease